MKTLIMVVMALLLVAVALPVLAGRIDPDAPANSPFSASYARRGAEADLEAARICRAAQLREERRNDDRDYRDDSRSYGRRGDSGRNSNTSRTEYGAGLSTKIGGTRIDLSFLNQIIKSSRGSSKPTVVVVEKPAQPVPAVVQPVLQSDKIRFSVVREDNNEAVSPLELPATTNFAKVLAVGNHLKYSRSGSFVAEYKIERISELFVYVTVQPGSCGTPQAQDSVDILAAL